MVYNLVLRRLLIILVWLPACFAGDIYAAEPLVSWCQSAGGCDEYISRVTIAEIDNASGCVGYSDFLNLTSHLEIGHFYEIDIEISGGYSMDSGGVWVDWNHNFQFDEPDEEVLLDVDGGPGPRYYGVICAPRDALSGDAVMRVRLCFNETPRPCGVTTYGEVEDYLVSITGESYRCGDADGDGAINVGDAVFLINHIFRSGPAPDPPGAGDADCNRTINIADAVYLVAYVFSGGPGPCCP